MEKLHRQFDQEELVRVAGRMVSLIDNSRHVKEASSNAMTREMLEAHKPDKDHFLLHVIAMGDHEHYGFNRNGDAWPKAACEKYHPTFVSHGHFFREHRNRNKDLAIGQIKASCYNAPMGRIELAVWGHRKKAEDVLEKAAAGQETSYSMSARVPYDRSSITQKKAKCPDEYDEYCRYRMGQYIPEHRKYAFVFNDHPTFFDISFVKNPADRIAHHLQYFLDPAEDMKKAASSGAINGFELARLEGVTLPSLPDATGCISTTRQALMEKLAALEDVLDAADRGEVKTCATQFYKFAARHALRGELSEEQIAEFRRIQPGTLFRKLAQRRVLLPFTSFAAYATGTTLAAAEKSANVAAGRADLPHVFTKLAATPCDAQLENSFDPSSEFMSRADLRCNDGIDRMMDLAAEQFSTCSGKVHTRVLATTSGESCARPVAKVAGDRNAPLAQLALAYAHYKLAAIEAIQDLNSEESDEALHVVALAQNRIN